MGTLRIILAIAVVVAHSNSFFGFSFTGGVVAVEIFFIISGFYMSMILDSKYVGKGSYKLFLSNRFLRLYPMFWTMLLITIIVSYISYYFSGDWFKLSPYIVHYETMSIETLLFQIIANIALFGQDIVMFLGMNPETGRMFFSSNFIETSPKLFYFLLIPQAWSLGIEVMFYVIAPFIVNKRLSIVIYFILASLFIRISTYYLGYDHDPWTYRFFPSELALFLLGNISYKMYKSYLRWNYFNRSNLQLVSGVFFLILLFYQYIPFRIGHFTHVINWGFYFFTCLSLPFIFQLTKSSKYDAHIGELSYPIYISHVLVVDCIAPILSDYNLQDYLGEFSVFFTVVVSYILVKIIADPIEKVRQSRVRKF